MLILSRKPGESIILGDDVKITVVDVSGKQVRLGIDAPKDIAVYREEIYQQIVDGKRHPDNTTGADAIV